MDHCGCYNYGIGQKQLELQFPTKFRISKQNYKFLVSEVENIICNELKDLDDKDSKKKKFMKQKEKHKTAMLLEQEIIEIKNKVKNNVYMLLEKEYVVTPKTKLWVTDKVNELCTSPNANGFAIATNIVNQLVDQ
jgi:hypothetical protein